MEEEQFKRVDDFWNYKVGDQGTLMDRWGKVKMVSTNQAGSAMVHMTRDGKQYGRSLALLVAQHFIAEDRTTIFNTPIHLDYDRLNCRVDNLIWRPRWFAVKYHAQAHMPRARALDSEFKNDETGDVFIDALVVAQRYGVLENSVLASLIDHRPVFPQGYRFSFI